MIVIGSEVIGTASEFYEGFRDVWNAKGKILDNLNNYYKDNTAEIKNMRDRPWEYE